MYFNLKITAILLFCIFSAEYVIADTKQPEGNDSITLNVNLNDVVVEAASMVNKADKKVYFPNKEIISQSVSGLDVLIKTGIHDIVVNPMNNTIELASKGKLSIRVNGKAINMNEVRAISPDNIIRIEYHDNPSMRFGNAEGVIDFIVKQQNIGGSVVLELKQGVTKGWGEYYLDTRINHKKSEFSYTNSYQPRWNLEMHRDNTEHFNIPGVYSIERTEKGIPTDIGYHQLWSQFGYNYTDQDKRMFSAQARMSYNDEYNNGFIGIIENSATNEMHKLVDAMPSKSVQPTLDLYYQEKIKKNQLLMLNVAGTYGDGKSSRIYTEAPIIDGEEQDFLTTDIFTNSKESNYYLFGEAGYEIVWGTSKLNTGIRHNQTWAKNTYTETDEISRTNKAETTIYAEYWKRLSEKIDFSIGAQLSRHNTNYIGKASTSAWILNPRLNIRYKVNNTSTLRLKIQSWGNSPILGQLSDVRQNIDSYQVSIGNPNLKSYNTYSAELKYEFSRSKLYFDMKGTYTFHNNPIMDYKYIDGNKIVSSYDNHRNAHTLRGSASISLRNLFGWVSAYGTVDYRRYIMHGNDYNHTYNNVSTTATVMLSHWNATLALGLQTNRNSFWGETLSGGEQIHYVMLDYKHKNAKFTIGMFNPFTNNYCRPSENRNQYANYQRNMYSRAVEKLLIVGFSWNFNWGRKHKSSTKRINNNSVIESTKVSGK